MSDLAKQIEEDLDWREAELASFKVLITRAEKGSIRRTALLRALWIVLYAHFEGFCKFAWDLYLDAVEREDVCRSDCSEAIARFSLEKRFRELKRDLSPESLWDFYFIEFSKLMRENITFEVKFETQNNLWPAVFRNNARKAMLSTQMLDEHEQKIKGLVARRNEIAHGKKMIIDSLGEYKKYEDAALLVMHELGVSVLECIENKRYLMKP